MGTVLSGNQIGGERRKHERPKRLVMSIRIDGKTYKTNDWSMGGFLLDNYEGALTTGALVTVAGLGRTSQNLHKVDLPARVVRTDESTIAVSYLSLDAEAYNFLQQSMSDCGDIRNLIEANS